MQKGVFVIDSPRIEVWLDNGVRNLARVEKFSSSASVMCSNHAISIPCNLWFFHSLTYPVPNAIATCTQRPKNKIEQRKKGKLHSSQCRSWISIVDCNFWNNVVNNWNTKKCANKTTVWLFSCLSRRIQGWREANNLSVNGGAGHTDATMWDTYKFLFLGTPQRIHYVRLNAKKLFILRFRVVVSGFIFKSYFKVIVCSREFRFPFYCKRSAGARGIQEMLNL